MRSKPRLNLYSIMLVRCVVALLLCASPALGFAPLRSPSWVKGPTHAAVDEGTAILNTLEGEF